MHQFRINQGSCGRSRLLERAEARDYEIGNDLLQARSSWALARV